MRRPCSVADSFADPPMSGDPPGVLLDAEGPDANAMPRFAGERAP